MTGRSHRAVTDTNATDAVGVAAASGKIFDTVAAYAESIRRQFFNRLHGLLAGQVPSSSLVILGVDQRWPEHEDTEERTR